MFKCECNFSKVKSVLLIVEKIDNLATKAYEFLSDRINGRIYLTTIHDDSKFKCFDLILLLAENNHIIPFEPVNQERHKKGKKPKKANRPKK